MKKSVVFLFFLSVLGFSQVVFANDVTYPTITIPHNQEIVFDLKKGNGGMHINDNYNVTCNITTDGEGRITLRRGGATIYVGSVNIDGTDVLFSDSAVIKIKPDSTLKFNSFFSTDEPSPVVGPYPTSLFILNMDKNDIQMNCSATKVS